MSTLAPSFELDHDILLQNHQVNALFVEGPHKIAVYGSEGEENGTFIGAMGFKLYDTKIQIEVTEEGEMTGTV